MDLLHFIINLQNCNPSCFLCFMQNENTTNLDEEFEIFDKYSSCTITLKGMVTDLFPGFDVLSSRSCKNCTSLIINMYVVLRRNKLKRNMLKIITDIINEEISSNNNSNTNNDMRLKINLSECEDIQRHELSNITHNRHSTAIKMNKTQCKSDQNIEKRSYNCNKCATTFKTMESFRKHKSICHKNANKSTVCHYCGKICRNSNALRAHLNCHNVKQCQYCLKYLKSNSHFMLHVKNHESGKKRQRNTYYNCHDCNYKSVSKNTLEAHINKLHLQIRPYVCQICFKGFYKKTTLTEHELIHKKLQKEMCEVCGEGFVTKKTFLIHMKLHKNEKAFECMICNKKFVTSGQRLEHFKRNHIEKTESCFLCDKKFGLKKDLTRHIKKVHPRDETTAQKYGFEIS